VTTDSIFLYALIAMLFIVGPLLIYAMARSRHALFLAKHGSWWALPLRGTYFVAFVTFGAFAHLNWRDYYCDLYYYYHECDDVPDYTLTLAYVCALLALLMFIMLISVSSKPSNKTKD
jgi:hypothetical protein